MIQSISVLALLTAPAEGYQYIWDDSGDPYRWELPAYVAAVNTFSFSVPGPYEERIERGVLAWDQTVVPGSRLATSVTTTYQQTHRNSDNVNSVSLIDLSDIPNEDFGDCISLGATEMRYSPHFLGIGADHILEADIVVDVDCVWDVSGGGAYYDVLDERWFDDVVDIEQIVLHEAGHAAGLEHAPGGRVFEGGDLSALVGWPATMAESNSGGSVFDDGFLARKYLANEDDREGVRQLYIPLPTGAFDWAAQSYRVDNDEALAAVSGADCGQWMGPMTARPEPRIDLFAAAEDRGEEYGNCPEVEDWGAPAPAAPPPPLAQFNGSTVRAQFTLNSLGTGTDWVAWELWFTDDLGATACNAPGCWVVADGTSNVGTNTPYQREGIDFEIPLDAEEDVDYSVVFRIDSDDAFDDEPDEENNVAVWNQQITALGMACGSCGTVSSGPSSAMPGLLLAVGVVRRRRGRAG